MNLNTFVLLSGRVSVLALACAMGAGSAAGQILDNEGCLEESRDTGRIDEPLILQCTKSTRFDPVFVEGRRVRVGSTAASVSVIPGDDIERLNALRLGDVLANVPGVFFSGLNGPRETPQIRNTLSFDNRTLFVEDGVPLQSSVFFDQSALGSVSYTHLTLPTKA